MDSKDKQLVNDKLSLSLSLVSLDAVGTSGARQELTCMDAAANNCELGLIVGTLVRR